MYFLGMGNITMWNYGTKLKAGWEGGGGNPINGTPVYLSHLKTLGTIYVLVHVTTKTQLL